MSEEITAAGYKARIAALEAQLLKSKVAANIEAVKPLCDVLGINAVDYIKATSLLSDPHKALCGDILKAASSKVTSVKHETTVQLLKLQTKRNKEAMAFDNALKVAQSMEALNVE